MKVWNEMQVCVDACVNRSVYEFVFVYVCVCMTVGTATAVFVCFGVCKHMCV